MREALVAALASVLLLAIMAATPSAAAAATSAYASSVLADNPLVYYRLDERSGPTAADASGNGQDGTYQSGVIFDASGAVASDSNNWAVSTSGLAVTDPGTTLPSGNAPRTVEFWLRGGVNNPIAFTYGGESGFSADQFRVTVYGGQLWLSIDSTQPYTSGQFVVNLPQAWWDGVWHLFDVTYDGTNALGYMDGQLVGNFHVRAPLATVTGMTGGPLHLGDRADLGAGWNLYSVDEFAVYPSALSATQIDAHWTLGGSATAVCAPVPTAAYAQSVVSDSPSLYLRLGDLVNDTTHFVAFDSSGHCTTAAPTNAAIMSSNAGEIPHGALASGDDGALTGVNDVAAASDASLPGGSSARTMEFWVRGGEQNPLDFVYGTGGGTNDTFRVQLYGGQLWLTVDSSHAYSSGQYTFNLPEAWWDGVWHLFDIAYDGTTARAYMDGQLVGGVAIGAPLNTVTGSGDLVIGGHGADLGAGWNPYSVDEFAVYPSALSATQIDAHWTLGGSAAAVCPPTPTTPYAQSVVGDSPTLYLRLGELIRDSTHYVAFDSSGNCTTPAPTNAQILSSYASEVIHGALAAGDDGALTAVNAAASASDTSLPSGNSARTMEFWVKGGEQNPLDFVYGTGGGTNDTFRVQLYGGQLWLTLDSSHTYASGQYVLNLPQVWWDGIWHLFDITYDGTTARGYMDGQLVGSFGVVSPLNTVTGNGDLLIGGHGADLGAGWNPYSVDEFAVYANALSATQIDAHWTLGGSAATVCPAAPTSPYAQSVVGDSPSLYLRLGDLIADSTHFVAFDSSGHCTTSAPTNAQILSSDASEVIYGAVAGGDDGALTAVGPAAMASDASLPSGNSARTIEFWARGGGQNPVDFSYGLGSGSDDTFRVEVYGAQLWLTVDSSHAYTSAQYVLDLPKSWWDGAWHLFDVTYDGTTARGYMDGQLVGSFGVLSPLATVTGNASLTIGGHPGDVGSGDNAYSLDEFAVYPSALSASQIATHMSTGEPTPTVTSVSPASGPTTGGNWVDVQGTGFVAGAGVTFGSNPSQRVDVVSHTDIRTVAPAGTGTVDIRVTTAGGTSAPVSADNYAYVAASTAMRLASPAVAPIVNQPATVTAAVAPSDGGGSVSFYADGSATPIPGCGAQPLTFAGQFQASCSTASLAVGTHTITANYTGDPRYAASAGATSFAVVPIPTLLSLASSSLQVNASEPVTLTATVTPSDGEGTVGFFANGSSTPLTGCRAQPLTDRTASGYSAICVTTELPVGTNTITALYSGGGDYATSQALLLGQSEIAAGPGASALNGPPFSPPSSASPVLGAPANPGLPFRIARRAHGVTQLKLGITLPGPGTLISTATSRRHALTKACRLVAKRAGRFVLTLKLTRAGARALARTGRLRVRIRITYTSTAGKATSVILVGTFGSAR